MRIRGSVVCLLVAAAPLLSPAAAQQGQVAELTDSVLHAKLAPLVESFRGRVGIHVRHLPSGRGVSINADELFPTASMIKLPILIAAFDAMERGELAFDQKLVYTDSLLYEGEDILGSYARVNEWLSAHGFEHTRVNSRTPGRNDDQLRFGWGQTTPREMVELLMMVREGRAVSRAASEAMYRFLTRIYWNGEALSQIPPWVQAASKQGAVNRSRSEAVLVNAPSGDYVFCVITREQEDESWEPDNEGYVLLRKVSAILWQHLEPQEIWSPPNGAPRYVP